jgi:hypothetical protein
VLRKIEHNYVGISIWHGCGRQVTHWEIFLKNGHIHDQTEHTREILGKLPVRMGNEARISIQCPMAAFVEPSVYTAGGSFNCYTSTYNAPLHIGSLLGLSQVCNGQVSLLQDVNLTVRGQSKPRNRVRSLL